MIPERLHDQGVIRIIHQLAPLLRPDEAAEVEEARHRFDETGNLLVSQRKRLEAIAGALLNRQPPLAKIGRARREAL